MVTQLFDLFISWLIDQLIDWLINRLADLLIDWWIDLLQLPHVISQLEKLEDGADDVSDGDSDPRVYNAVIQLLTYMPLLDVVDTKCKLVYLLTTLVVQAEQSV